jgi:hypothetical protein
MSETVARVRENTRRIDELSRELARVRDLAKATAEQMKQTAGRMPGGDSSGLIRVWLPTGIAAGTFGTPASKTDCVMAVRSGTGWTTTGGITGQTIYNSDTTAVTGAKAGWATMRSDQTLELLVADC